MSAALRIMDVNANRAREALRIMEEAARFVLDDATLVELLKTIRHDLVRTLRPISETISLHRDTPGDVGTVVSAAGEYERATIGDVAAASGKRLAEALRAIEEYGKMIDGGMARSIEQIRYRAYEAEAKLNRSLAARAACQWRLCLLLSRALCRLPWRETLTLALDGGVDCVQVREKQASDRDIAEHVREVLALCRARGVAVIVNDRADIALATGADGAHLGQDDLPASAVRTMTGPGFIIGVSTSSLEQAKQALRDGADYCGVGPMFDTTTKHKDIIVGPAYLREYLAWGRLPHLAIGGITPDNIGCLIEAACQGVAVSGAIACSATPREVASCLRKAMPLAAGSVAVSLIAPVASTSA